MKKTLELFRSKFSKGYGVEDRELVKRKSRPNKGLHRRQFKAMLKWDQHPVVAYK